MRKDKILTWFSFFSQTQIVHDYIVLASRREERGGEEFNFLEEDVELDQWDVDDSNSDEDEIETVFIWISLITARTILCIPRRRVQWIYLS